jgi:hypothetical protein
MNDRICTVLYDMHETYAINKHICSVCMCGMNIYIHMYIHTRIFKRLTIRVTRYTSYETFYTRRVRVHKYIHTQIHTCSNKTFNEGYHNRVLDAQPCILRRLFIYLCTYVHMYINL